MAGWRGWGKPFRDKNKMMIVKPLTVAVQ